MSWLRFIILPAILHPLTALRGYREAGDVFFDADPFGDRSIAYAVGATIRAGVEA